MTDEVNTRTEPSTSETMLKDHPLGANPKLDELMVLAAVGAANESGAGYDLTVLKKHAAHAAKLWDEHWSEPSTFTEDWTQKLAELYTWTGSQEVEDQPQLYSFLCSLIGYLMTGQELASGHTALLSQIGVLREALTPSADTKAAYMGEFRFAVEICHPRLGSESRSVDVPWTTIKEIMAAISKRAALSRPLP